MIFTIIRSVFKGFKLDPANIFQIKVIQNTLKSICTLAQSKGIIGNIGSIVNKLNGNIEFLLSKTL
jgi:hypothetical protein